MTSGLSNPSPCRLPSGTVGVSGSWSSHIPESSGGQRIGSWQDRQHENSHFCFRSWICPAGTAVSHHRMCFPGSKLDASARQLGGRCCRDDI